MSLNLTIQKINNFFLILYVEISVLIGHIPRLFLTDALEYATFYRLFKNFKNTAWDEVSVSDIAHNFHTII